jgi:hypothetical protein
MWLLEQFAEAQAASRTITIVLVTGGYLKAGISFMKTECQ